MTLSPEKIRNGTLTGITLFLLLIGLLLSRLYPPDPPIPEEGIELSFGDTPSGWGKQSPRRGSMSSSSSASTTPQPQANRPVLTNEPDASNINLQREEEPSKQQKKLEDQQRKVREEKERRRREEQVKQQINDHLSGAFSGKGKSPEPNRGMNEGKGMQGSLHGNKDAFGSGGRGGISHSFKGRGVSHLHRPVYSQQKEGIVVVRIKVDHSGKVLSAEPGMTGSTTTDGMLFAAAKAAALKTRFAPTGTHGGLQQGTITYHFILE